LLAAVAGGPVYADCSYPKAPDHLPDGNTSTLQQMLAGQSAVKAYNADIKAYTDCLRLEHDQALSSSDPTKMTPDEKKAYDRQKTELDNVLIQKNDAAVDAATNVTNRFNDQVKVYKAKHKS
ncbi:MAG: hypothetical protein ACRD6W_15985, partial [Nitrososphaerales archaeon]